MYNLIMILHIIIVACLIAVILVQRGRSGGLVEALGGVESIFGTKTNAFFVKTTVVLSFLFFASSISLVYLSKQKGKSLLENYKEIPVQKTSPANATVPMQAAVPVAAPTTQAGDSTTSGQTAVATQKIEEKTTDVKPVKEATKVAGPANSTN